MLKTAAPGAAPEAKEALRQGKLPREARLRLVSGEREYAWHFKGDTLGLANLSILSRSDTPAEINNLIQTGITRWSRLAKEKNIKVD